jgi:hypothetical protein
MEINEPQEQLPRLIANNKAFAPLLGVQDQQLIDRFIFEKSIFMYVPSNVPILHVDEKFYPRQNQPSVRPPRKIAPFLLREQKVSDLSKATHIEFKGTNPNYRFVVNHDLLLNNMAETLQQIRKCCYSSCEVLPDEVKLVVEYIAKDKKWLRQDVITFLQRVIQRKLPDSNVKCLLFRVEPTRFRVVFPHLLTTRKSSELLQYIIESEKKPSLKTRVQFADDVYERGYMSIYGSLQYCTTQSYTVTFFGEYDENGLPTTRTPTHLEILQESTHRAI